MKVALLTVLILFIRDSVNTSSWTAAQPWINSKVYYITPLEDQIEVIDENNFRLIKLHLPFRENFTWKGNRYLATQPYTTGGFNFSNDDNMATWNYTYSALIPLFSYRNINYSNVYQIDQVDEKTLIDTIKVVGNQVTIPANKTSAWLSGSSTAEIAVNVTTPTNGLELRLYNYTNNPIKLGNITTPVGYSRTYEYRGGQWGFGSGKRYFIYRNTIRFKKFRR